MKLYHKLEIEINRSVDDVGELFRDRTLIAKWQHGLLSSDPLPTLDGKLRYKLIFQFGRRKMIMTETIMLDDLPKQYHVVYKMKGVRQSIHNSFSLVDNTTTIWKAETEFHFSGLMSLIARFMKPGFEQQSSALMRSFKAMAESDSRQ